MTIEKTTIIGDVLDFDETTAQYFLEMGMHCLGCPASRGETIEEACEACEEIAEAVEEVVEAVEE